MLVTLRAQRVVYQENKDGYKAKYSSHNLTN